MGFMNCLTALAITSTLFSFWASALDIDSKTNLAVYWGQGYGQDRLRHFCQESTLDIIPIGFINVFPDQGPGGWPGSNFGNQCDGAVYSNGSVTTKLLSGCQQIADDIPVCQAAGKKILLSLGGGDGKYQIDSDESATKFADFLWGAFGPKTLAWGTGPRPFGDAIVDGFDFDIEVNGDTGYATMVDRLRELFKEDKSKQYYISAAPQCVVPDPQLGDAIKNSFFDFIFVQFYNTMTCSARDWVSNGPSSGFTFDEWVDVIQNSANPDAKLFIGLPASEGAAADPVFYLTPDEVKHLVKKHMKKHPNTFGGVMLWEATASDLNIISGKSYADNVKEILEDCAKPDTSSSGPGPTSPSGWNGTVSTPTPAGTGTYPAGTGSRPSSSSKYPSGTGAGPTGSYSGSGIYPTGGPPTGYTSGVPYPTHNSTITLPPGTATVPTGYPGETVTTVIVTSYVSICPTGFTTITTTYTTTYCPGTVAATPTSPPEGWVTYVTVCTVCAATPTTVTLTVPIPTVTVYPIPATPPIKQEEAHPTTFVVAPVESQTQACYGVGCPAPNPGVKAESPTGRQPPNPTYPVQFTGAAAPIFAIGKLTTVLGALVLALSFAW